MKKIVLASIIALAAIASPLQAQGSQSVTITFTVGTLISLSVDKSTIEFGQITAPEGSSQYFTAINNPVTVTYSCNSTCRAYIQGTSDYFASSVPAGENLIQLPNLVFDADAFTTTSVPGLNYVNEPFDEFWEAGVIDRVRVLSFSILIEPGTPNATYTAGVEYTVLPG